MSGDRRGASGEEGAERAGEVEPAGEGAPGSDSDPVASATAHRAGVRVVGTGDTLGRYRLGAELGTGGMATVLAARDPELRRDVAVKVLLPHLARNDELRRRFHREARAAAGLEHPNILRVYDVGGEAADTPPYIVMELVRGQSLRELVESTGPLLAELVACIGVLACDALTAAHRTGIIHRDVKPANLMLSDDGRLLLADFGVARLDDDDSLVTRTGALLGTPSFMAPEQALGQAVDARSDVYAAGAMLYQLATGCAPYGGPAAKAISDAAKGLAPPAVRRRPAVGNELSRVIERMMAPRAEQRPSSAAAAGEQLRAIVAAGGLGEPRDEIRELARDRVGWEASRRPIVVARLLERAGAGPARISVSQALALVDRALALAPDDPAARALAAALSQRPARSARLATAGLGVMVAAAGGYWVLRDGEDPAARETKLALGSARDGEGSGGSPPALVADAGASESEVSAEVQAAEPAMFVPTDLGVSMSHQGASRVLSDPPSRRAAAGGMGPGLRVPAAPPPAAPQGASDKVAPRGDRPRAPEDPQVASDTVAPPGDRPRAPEAPQVAGDTVAPRGDRPRAPELHAPEVEVTFAFDTWCELSIDGVDAGRINRTAARRLPIGAHRVVCRQGPGLPGWSTTLELVAGTPARIEGTLLSAVEITIASGDSVQIGTATYRRGARVRLRPGRYRVVVRSGDRITAERHVDIPSITRCELRDQPLLDCYP